MAQAARPGLFDFAALIGREDAAGSLARVCLSMVLTALLAVGQRP